MGGRTISSPLREIVSRGGTTLAGRTRGHRSLWRLVRGGRLRTLISLREPFVDPVVSADGRHVAWVTSRVIRHVDDYTTDQVFTLHAYDVVRGRLLGTTSLESRVTCCDAGGVYEIAGVDDDGTVLVSHDYERLVGWRPGHDPRPVTGAVRPGGVEGLDQWPGGATWSTTGDSSGPAGFGRIDPAGVTSRVGRVPQGQGGVWSPDGTSYVFEPFDKAAEQMPGDAAPVVWTSGRSVRLQVRRPGSVLGWEDPRTVILLSSGARLARSRAALLRCDARSGRCERAGPVLHHVVLPGNGP